MKKGTFLLESVGLEPTHDPQYLFFRDPRLYRLSYDSVGIGDNKKQWVFPTCFILTITLMIRVTTDLVPSRFLAYNQLLKALTGVMVIAYVIMIRKVI